MSTSAFMTGLYGFNKLNDKLKVKDEYLKP